MSDPPPAPMPYTIAGGLKVFFPFEPYETQKQYMTKVIESIKGKHNALLESPTGTGKTLSLLCASLAWQQSQGGKNQKMIYYTSRTHMQLSQAAKEMKKTAYARVPAVVIGSRAQMCINDDVKQQPAHLINRSCQNAIARNACAYHANYEQKLETIDQNQVHDIEDMHQFARSHQCCPYYASRKLAETKASIVFMPYNYLLDISLRKSSLLRLENSVVIFDEAHNIESSLTEAASGSIRESCLKTIQKSCFELPTRVSQALHREKHGLTRTGYEPKEQTSDDSGKKEKEAKPNRIEELAEKLTNDRIQQVNACAQMLEERIKLLKMDQVYNTDLIYKTFEEARIEYSTASQITDTLDSMIAFWSIAGVMNVNEVSKSVVALGNLNHMILLLFPEGCSLQKQQNHKKTLKDAYSTFLEGFRKDNVLKDGPIYDWELNLWCLHPKLGLDRIFEETCINGPRSLIITSGTLSPLNAIVKSLGREFRYTESFSHVIDEKQLKIVTIFKSPKGNELHNTFKNIVPKHIEQLGSTILPLLAPLPFGTLVFFPSYGMMNLVMKHWISNRNWLALSKMCAVFKETTDKESFESNLAAYKRKIGPPNDLTGGKAVFFGVCRGKLSEGINLEGNHCRTVVVIGVPYPNPYDPKVVAMTKFNNDRGNPEWINEQMRRALNQTLGRAIRSKDDYGMLMLVDSRYTAKAFRTAVSNWARPYFPKEGSNPLEVDALIETFFATHGVVVERRNLYDFTTTSGNSAFELDASRPNPRAIFQNEPSKQANQSSQGSQKPTGTTNKGTAKTVFRPTNTITVEDRLNQMRRDYTVDRTTFERVTQAREARAAESAARTNEIPQKRATTADIVAAIFSSEPPSQLNSQGSSTDWLQEPPKSKRPRTSDPVFTNSQAFPQAETQASDYSILERDPDRPSKYKCYICSQEAVRPRATNCKCARVGCEDCIRVLHNKECPKCLVLLKKQKFKPRLFHSAFSKKERMN